MKCLPDSGLQQQLMSSNNGHLTELSSLSQYNEQSANFDNAQYRNLPAPPAYPGDSIRHQSPNPQGLEQMTLQNGGNGVYRDISDIALQGRSSNMGMYSQHNSVYSPQEAMMLQARISPASSQLSVNTQSPQLSSPSRSPQGHQQISPNYGNQGSYSGPNQQSSQEKQMSPQQLASRQVAAANSQQQRSLLQQCLEAPPSESLLRAALTQKNQAYQMSLSPSPSTQSYSPPPPPPPQYSNIRYDGQQINARLASPSQQRHMPSMNSNNINNNIISAQSVNRNLSMMSGGGILQQSRQQQRNMGGQNISDLSMSQLQTGMASTGGQLTSSTSMSGHSSGNSLNEINDTVNFDDLSVEEILNYELTCEGNLDFTETFDPVNNSVTTSADTQNLVR
ncbi:hypothetical protein KUTeg_007003 [Tegillarca granosa]|uniref:Uncharacterized protein n=1 Tax=Tegillarca granosa TaxID=220873 RepID=A0ABQ9FBZ8_TEGGR|nr:hypothetical protein KUTeg_007003 [Tegillarca granosa]